MKKLFLLSCIIASSISAMEIEEYFSSWQKLEPGEHEFTYQGNSLLVDNREFPEITREELEARQENWGFCSALTCFLGSVAPGLFSLSTGFVAFLQGAPYLTSFIGITSLSSGAGAIPCCLAGTYGCYKYRQASNQEQKLGSLLDLPTKPGSKFYTNIATTPLTLHDIATIKNLLGYIERDEGHTELNENMENNIAELNRRIKDGLKENVLFTKSTLARLAAAARLVAYSDCYEETIKLNASDSTITDISFELSPKTDDSLLDEKKHLFKNNTITIDGACAKALMAVQYPRQLEVPYAHVLINK